MDIILMLAAILFLVIFAKIDKQLFYKSKKPIGDLGESIVAYRLNTLDDNYIIKNNVHLGRCQIDHMIICKTSPVIFVVETKFWSGVITGSYNDKTWVQNKNGQIKYLRNPIKQNIFHCNTVKKFYTGYNVYNIVVFVRNNNVPNYKNIIKVENLINYIYQNTI